MTISLKNILIGLLILLAASLSGWSVFLSSKSPILVTRSSSDLPDAFMENVIATVMNKVGNPSLKVETPKMTHYPTDDATELTSPHVTVYRESPQPWHINADHAKTKQGVSEIAFWDNVVIHHQADNDNPLTTMQTAALTIFPEQQIAKTNVAVTVQQPETTVHAVGMLANWDQGTVHLLSQAREEYAPKSR